MLPPSECRSVPLIQFDCRHLCALQLFVLLPVVVVVVVVFLLPRDARSAKRAIAIVSRHLSVRRSVLCNVEVSWSYRLGYFESSYMDN